eukprot:TRINITY_DN11906_c0_g1_i1.p1 TRINITY_DN11906_c0_g1~~TRINITY_DN11906_c0_g1_i1.p1  ORF type:complete len:178 (-),score=34.55 TRINITY_DN11906_c0_g1_i1:105-590(-)
MKISQKLIQISPTYINAIEKFELNLRSQQISFIENLECTNNVFQSIDLSDNYITILENFPEETENCLTRLEILLLINNKINKIDDNISLLLPNLQDLILTNNEISSIEDLEPLQDCENLQRLSLIGNPCMQNEGFRRQVIDLLPQLKSFNFVKISQKEKEG